jgi:hypothetical protein
MSYDGQLIILCEIEYSVVFCLVRAVRTFLSRLVTNWTPNKWQSVESDGDLYFDITLVFFLLSASLNKEPNYTVKAKGLLLSSD